MGLHHAVDAHLDLMHLEAAQDVGVQQHAVREKDLAQVEVGKQLVDLVESRVEKRLAARKQHPEPLHILELTESAQDLRNAELLAGTAADIAVLAPQVAAVRDLELQVAE